jgi:hypothetical protein
MGYKPGSRDPDKTGAGGAERAEKTLRRKTPKTKCLCTPEKVGAGIMGRAVRQGRTLRANPDISLIFAVVLRKR